MVVIAENDTLLNEMLKEVRGTCEEHEVKAKVKKTKETVSGIN